MLSLLETYCPRCKIHGHLVEYSRPQIPSLVLDVRPHRTHGFEMLCQPSELLAGSELLASCLLMYSVVARLSDLIVEHASVYFGVHMLL